jgi:chemotaxis signal transduction protein
MVVDTVLEVVNIPAPMVARAPEYVLSLHTNFVMALGKLNGGETSILLDIDKVLDIKGVESALEGAR